MLKKEHMNMETNKRKRIVVASILAISAVVAVGAVVLIARANDKAERYHDNWMPSDIEWTVYLGDEAPSKNKGFDGDYFVILNNWTTFHKVDDNWVNVGEIVELKSVHNANIKWVNQLYDLYCKTNSWYLGTTNEWVYDLRDGYLFNTQHYDVHFYGEKIGDEIPKDYGLQTVRRRENVVYQGEIPLKEFDTDYFYSFDQWDHDLGKVTESFNTYAIFAKYDNGSLVDVDGDEIHVGFNEDDPIKKSVVSIDIPEYIQGKPVTKIDDAAFSECSNLQSINLPSTIEYIGEHAFFGCSSLTEIFIPESVTSIGETTFSSSLVNLEQIKVDENNPNYKDVDGVLYTKNGKTIMRYPPKKEHTGAEFIVPADVEYISSFCFADFAQDNLEQFVFPSNLKRIGTWSLKNTSITELNLPDNCELLSGNFVSGCLNLETINCVNNIYYESINGVLYSKDLTTLIRVGEGYNVAEDLIIPNTVSRLGFYSFSGTNIESMVISSNITQIDSYCFSYLENNCSIYLPDTLTKVLSRAFYASHGLTIDCQVLEKPATWADDWAYTREERADENDSGYVSQINFGVDPL